jgi:DNA repair exonuclease SbcCD ATPase subunit
MMVLGTAQSIKQWRNRADALLAASAAAKATKDRTEIRLERARTLGVAVTKAGQVAQTVAESIQHKTYWHIAGVVSRCLKAVFDDPYEFKMNFVRRRGRTEVDLSFEREGESVDPMTASGGGVIDVASFALRLSALALGGPSVRKMLILDEPFKYLSESYRGRIRDMLELLSGEFKMQILMVTHISELRVGKVIELEGS